MGQVVKYIQLIIMILTYSKDVVDLALSIYDRIERSFKDSDKPKEEKSKEKALTWNSQFVKAVAESIPKNTPRRMKAVVEANVIREKIWRYKNQTPRLRKKVIE